MSRDAENCTVPVISAQQRYIADMALNGVG